MPRPGIFFRFYDIQDICSYHACSIRLSLWKQHCSASTYWVWRSGILDRTGVLWCGLVWSGVLISLSLLFITFALQILLWLVKLHSYTRLHIYVHMYVHVYICKYQFVCLWYSHLVYFSVQFWANYDSASSVLSLVMQVIILFFFCSLRPLHCLHPLLSHSVGVESRRDETSVLLLLFAILFCLWLRICLCLCL